MPLSEDERRLLHDSWNRELRIAEWIMEGALRLFPYLEIPGPIFSPCVQAHDNAIINFHASCKLADIPFPFVFTQMLSVMLAIAIILVPPFTVLLSFAADGEVNYLAALLGVIVCVPLIGLNEMSKELENPFGMDPNDVPLLERLERFTESLVDIYFSSVPMDHMPLTHHEELLIGQMMEESIAIAENGGSPEWGGKIRENNEGLQQILRKLKSPARRMLNKDADDCYNSEFVNHLEAFQSSTISEQSSEDLKIFATEIKHQFYTIGGNGQMRLATLRRRLAQNNRFGPPGVELDDLVGMSTDMESRQEKPVSVSVACASKDDVFDHPELKNFTPRRRMSHEERRQNERGNIARKGPDQIPADNNQNSPPLQKTV